MIHTYNIFGTGFDTKLELLTVEFYIGSPFYSIRSVNTVSFKFKDS